MSDLENIDEGIELHPKPEKPTRLRVPVIVAGGAIIAAILIVTIIFSFSRPSNTSTDSAYDIPVAEIQSPRNEALNQLPADYDQMPPEEELQSIPPIEPLPEAPKQVVQTTPTKPDQTADEVWAAGMFFDGKNKGGRNSQYAYGQTGSTAAQQDRQQGLIGGGQGNYAADLPAEDQQNLQGQKLEFLKQSQARDDFILNDRLHAPVSPYEVKAGTLVPAALITAINSDLPGDVIAQVSEHVYDTVTGRFLLIPQGSRLYGRYDSVVSYGQERVLVAWQRLVLPNGKSIQLDGMIAADPAGASGLEDQVDNHFMRLAGAVLLSTAVSLGGNIANDDDDDSIGNDVGDTVAQEASRVGQRFVSKSMNIQPTIKIRGGAEVRVFVNKDMILEPYQEL